MKLANSELGLGPYTFTLPEPENQIGNMARENTVKPRLIWHVKLENPR